AALARRVWRARGQRANRSIAERAARNLGQRLRRLSLVSTRSLARNAGARVALRHCARAGLVREQDARLLRAAWSEVAARGEVRPRTRHGCAAARGIARSR